MIPERIPPLEELGEEGVCRMASKWMVSPVLVARLAAGAGELPYPIQIISGYRTAENQEQLRLEGRPTARDDLSTHRSCPATGADILPVGVTVVGSVKAAIGTAMTRAGLRWGGGSKVDSSGIPSDWNHFDLGPRQ